MPPSKQADDLIPYDLALEVAETLAAHDEERRLNRENAEKARGSFKEFLKMAWPIMEPNHRLIPGWHIDAICDHLEAAYRGDIKRLLITVPPGTAKSKLTSVAWPAWIWTINPGFRSIFGSYDAGLATRDSIYCRDLMMSAWYQETFNPAWKLSDVQNEKTFYTNTAKGFRIATSVGGKSLGTGWRGDLVACFAADTKIITEAGELEIGKVVEQRIPVRVLAFNHESGFGEWRRIEKYECSPGRPSVRVTLSNGTSFECTEDHPIFCPSKGYVSAVELSGGDALLSHSELHVLRSRTPTQAIDGRPPEAGSVLRKRLHGEVANQDRLREVLPKVPSLLEARIQSTKTWVSRKERILRSRMSSDLEPRAQQSSVSRRSYSSELYAMWHPVHKKDGRCKREKLLFSEVHGRLQSSASSEDGESSHGNMRSLRVAGQGEAYGAYRKEKFLLAQLRESGSPRFDERSREPEFYSREWSRGVPGGVPRDRSQYSQKRQVLSTLRDAAQAQYGRSRRSSYRLRQTEQRSSKSDHAMPVVSSRTSSWEAGGSDKDPHVFVVSIERIATPDRVYNIRVERDHNYFAGGVLVHNCDDPISTKDEDSDAALDNCVTWWDRVMYNRFDNMSMGIKVIIMQRVSDRDLAGHVLRAGGYEHLMIPNEFEPDRSKVTMIGSTEFWRDPRKTRGELMCDRLITQAVTKELKTDPHRYTGQYQQNPHPEGAGVLKPHHWNYWKPRNVDLPPVRVRLPGGEIEERQAIELPVEFDIVVMSWDMAFKDTKDSDFVAGGTMAARGSRKFLLDAIHERMDLPKSVQAVREMRGRGWGAMAQLTLIEDKANGPAVMQTLGEEISGMIAVNPEGGKVSRARAASYDQQAGNWYLPHPSLARWVGDPADPSGGGGFIQECTAFPNGAHDDFVDMFSQGAIRIKSETEANVFKSRENDIIVQPHAIPPHWKRVYGLCVTWNEIAAVWLAFDPQSSNFELTHEYWAIPTDPNHHVKEIKEYGGWIPGVISAVEDQRQRGDGYLLAERYVNLGLKLDAAPETHEQDSITGINAALAHGKLKVWGNASKFFDQYRMYRRDPKGKLPKDNVALMKALQTAWQWGHERMRAEHHHVVAVKPIEIGRTIIGGGGWMAG